MDQETETPTRRRGMLRRVLGASAAAALLLGAREATTAEAASRTTVLTGAGSTDDYETISGSSIAPPGRDLTSLFSVCPSRYDHSGKVRPHTGRHLGEAV